MDRREFLLRMAQLSGVAVAGGLIGCDRSRRPDEPGYEGDDSVAKSKPEPTDEDRQDDHTAIAVVFATSRADGVHRATELLDLDFRDQHIFIKPNFNSADPAPGSTHNDVLEALVRHCRSHRTRSITVGDRSGMADTREVMRQKQIFAMGDELGFETVVFDELEEEDWRLIEDPEHHWQRGFAMPRIVLDADAYVQTCCLKTHRFGGHFTMALKNNVGLAAKNVPGDDYNYMSELHDSEHQRRMIAELNSAVSHDLIVLDAVEGFYEEGPEAGPTADFNVVIAGTDPVAIDALGVALLRRHGTTPEVSEGSIAEQSQIARAIELGIGTANPDEMNFLTPDDASREIVADLIALLDQ